MTAFYDGTYKGCLFIRQWFTGYELRLYIGMRTDEFNNQVFKYLSASCSIQSEFFSHFELFECLFSPANFNESWHRVFI